MTLCNHIYMKLYFQLPFSKLILTNNYINYQIGET